MDYKKQILKLLFELKNLNIDRPEIEQEIGVSDNYIDQVLSRGGNKQAYSKIKMYYDLKLRNATNHADTEGETPSVVNEHHTPLEKDVHPGNRDLSMQTILNLSQSQAELIKTNAALTETINRITSHLTVDAGTGNQINIALAAPVLEILAKEGKGKLWKSVDEGRRLLGSMLFFGMGPKIE